MSMQIDGKVVRKLRLERGLTQEHLATLTNRTTRTVQRVERSGACDLETRSALASVFQIPISQLDRRANGSHSPPGETTTASEGAPETPIGAASLFAYANAHSSPLDLIHAIAQRRGLEVRCIDTETAWLNEQVEALKIKTIRELDSLVKEHAAIASRLCDYLSPEGPVDAGFVLARVLEIVAIERGGKQGLVSFCTSLKYSSGGAGWAAQIFNAYEEIRGYG